MFTQNFSLVSQFAGLANYFELSNPTTNLNQVIMFIVCLSIEIWFKVERWLREFHQRMDKFYKEDLAKLKNQCHCDSTIMTFTGNTYFSNTRKLYEGAN